MDQDKYIDTMIENIKEKSGKPIEYWVKVVNKSGLEKHGQIIKLLKEEHGFTHGYANMIAHCAKDSSALTSKNNDDYVSIQYTGKESLRPIYDKIIKQVSKFGNDVEVSPKKAYVSLRAKKQFALIQPSTKTRVDIGINLKGKTPTDRLEISGSFNSMCSHRVKVTTAKVIDKELIAWLKEAYEAAR